MMISQLTKSQKAIVKTVKEFAKGEFDKDLILEMDRAGRFPRNIWEKAADLGFLGIHLSEKCAGGGMSMTDHMLTAETFSAHDSTTGGAIMLSGIGVEWLARFGGDGVKEKYLPRILEGRMLPGAPFPKPGVGVTISAAASGQNLCVNGVVDGVINGGGADLFLLPINDPQGGFVIVETDLSGVAVESRYQPLGLRMTSSAKIRLADVEIDKANRVDIKPTGNTQLLPELRMLLAALALGTARGAIDRSLIHLKQREQFGRKLAKFQALRHKVAQSATQLYQARCLTFAAAESFASKRPDVELIAMACLSAVSSAVEITFGAIQLLGGYGYTVEYDVERCCRDAKTLQLLSGGSMTLYDEIANAVIGKIR